MDGWNTVCDCVAKKKKKNVFEKPEKREKQHTFSTTEIEQEQSRKKKHFSSQIFTLDIGNAFVVQCIPSNTHTF